jgi:tetratricopeptide (TPR) repeat protein
MMQRVNTAFVPRASGFGLRSSLLSLLLTLPALATPETVAPASPREYFNAGTRQLSAGKLREAEASLETALASQDQWLQPPALYNLGIVRFGQGLEELKKGPAAKPAVTRGQSATQQGDEALHQAEGALASNDVLRMVAAYMRGRGARKELKGATEAVQRALKAHGSTLARWERSSGDLKSTLELNRADSDARYNAEIVDRTERCLEEAQGPHPQSQHAPRRSRG